MKLHLLNPTMRYISSFHYSRHGDTVLSPDNHIQYVLCGSVSISISDTPHILYQDTLIYYPKGTVYSLNSLSENCKLISMNFDFGQEEFSDLAPRFPQAYISGTETPTDPMLLEIAENDSFLSSFTCFYNAQEYLPYLLRIMDNFRRSMPYSRNLCSCILKELLILLHYTPSNISYNSRQTVQCIINYIEENYAKPITNKNLSTLFGYHPNYLCKLFKNNIQMSPQQYIHNLRLAHAKKLIEETQLPLEKIAEMIGFQDYPYFSTSFKKKNGLSPSDYRIQSLQNG